MTLFVAKLVSHQKRSLKGQTKVRPLVNGSEMLEAKHVSGKNICCVKMFKKHAENGKKIFVHCPFL